MIRFIAANGSRVCSISTTGKQLESKDSIWTIRGPVQSWLAQLTGRRHKNVAAVALANKNARIVWALLAHDRYYQADYSPSAV
jgi:hypothetical protein